MTNINSSSLIPRYTRDSNDWKAPPKPLEEIERLQERLRTHLVDMNVQMTKRERINYVVRKLIDQNETCAFGKYVNGKYCWNAVKDESLSYLKLTWGHIMPQCRKEKDSPANLCLLCARCNEKLQGSRDPGQLMVELESKMAHIAEIIASTDCNNV